MNVDDFLKRDIDRRQFLGKSAQNAAGMAAGIVGLSGTVAKAAPSERVTLAIIGTRSQGKRLASSMASFPDLDLVAICDIDDSLLPATAKVIEDIQGWAPRHEKDFRRILDDKSIQAVVIATPDHWHAIMGIMACQAGKDVYVETPISHNIHEGARLVEATRKYNRIVQSGMQQRSGSQFQSAVQLVRSGSLGNVHLAKAWTVHRRKPIGFKQDGISPKGVDYDLWLGPAPVRRFNANRFHHNWRWFWDYGTGELGNWGVHVLDIARWGLGVSLPISISATGGKYAFHDAQETPDTLIVQYGYCQPDVGQEVEGVHKTIIWEHRLWSTHGIEGRSAATAFYGDQGTLVVDRGGWKLYDVAKSITAGTSDQARMQHRNFIDCVKSRQKPTADIEIGHVSSTLCHLGNIAYRLDREVRFDPINFNFGNDTEANSLLQREYRHPWYLES